MILPRLALAALLATVACAEVDPLALSALSDFDPLTADPASVVARLDLPPGIAIPEGGATLTLDARRSDTGETLARRYAFTEAGDLWRLPETDAAALRDLRGAGFEFVADREAHASLVDPLGAEAAKLQTFAPNEALPARRDRPRCVLTDGLYPSATRRARASALLAQLTPPT